MEIFGQLIEEAYVLWYGHLVLILHKRITKEKFKFEIRGEKGKRKMNRMLNGWMRLQDA